MGFLIKFLLFFVVAYLLMKGFVAFLMGKRNTTSTTNRQSSQHQPKLPETQEDRIIEYQKKTFEKSEAEDVEFTEIKQPQGES